MSSDLGLIVMHNFEEFGRKVDKHLQKMNKRKESYIVHTDQIRFNNGEGKVVINETIRAKDVFVLSDVGNYDCTYKMFDYQNHMSCDDHLQDIKRVVSAMSGHANKITLVTPLLYGSRQHKRKTRESLDCAMALQEFRNLGVQSIVMFDVHDPNVQNAIPCLSFENFYPTNIVLKEFIDKEKINLANLLVVSPDTGAADRARHYAEIFQSDVGMFYKRRDLSVIVDGKNPVVAHEYIGKDVTGKDIILVDDMIASGDSVLEVVHELKERGANNIYIFVTYALFTKGIKAFEEEAAKGEIKKIYTTNLSYVPKSMDNKKWFVKVDCSLFVAQIINTLYNRQSISHLMNNKEEIFNKLEEYK